MQGVKVLKPGLFSSIQDLGRRGYRAYGVPQAGAMDKTSAALANHLLNNKADAAVLEVTLLGPVLQFLSATRIALSGADLSAQINGRPMALNMALEVKEGDELTFGKALLGCRCYISVQGGFQTEVVLGSRAYFSPLTSAGVLQKGDLLPISPLQQQYPRARASLKVDEAHFQQTVLSAWRGPEFDLLSMVAQQQLFEQQFSVSQDNNRMGIRLEGTGLPYPENFSMLTSAVQAGTVQLTPSGQLIVLMRDAQTTGGYPRVLQLSETPINQLAQKRTGNTFSFIEKAK